MSSLPTFSPHPQHLALRTGGLISWIITSQLHGSQEGGCLQKPRLACLLSTSCLAHVCRIRATRYYQNCRCNSKSQVTALLPWQQKVIFLFAYTHKITQGHHPAASDLNALFPRENQKVELSFVQTGKTKYLLTDRHV